ncbi:MAG: fluoride efflux transporter CrcB [Cyanobacteria bacterium SZAS LIN-5]|nr:fluoride efflux transporter CrcB [Cyanobacteria bacterium SZAS LIN-5]
MNQALLINTLAVALGGSVGSIARFWSGQLFSNWFGTTFPWATLFVNIVGSAFLGFVFSFSIAKPGAVDPNVRLLLTTGFSGGFTTFSAFAWETLSLYQKGDTTLALANIGANLLLGFIAVFLGYLLGRVV